jgi:hypothetical protein
MALRHPHSWLEIIRSKFQVPSSKLVPAAIGGLVHLWLTQFSSRRYQSNMTDLTELDIDQLKSILAIMEVIEKLQNQVDTIMTGGNGGPTALAVELPKKRRMSAAGRARIAAGAGARWAKTKGATAKLKPARRRDRRSSPAVRAKLAAAARARWAKVKAAGKKTL